MKICRCAYSPPSRRHHGPFKDFVDGDVDEVLSCDPNSVVNPRRFVTALDIASEVLRASACGFFLLS